MKKRAIRLKIVLFAGLLAFGFPSSGEATNGIHLLASSAIGQGRAGATSARAASTSDSLLANPSLLTSGKLGDSNLEFSMSALFLDVSSRNSEATPFGGTNRFYRSEKNFVPVPTFAYARSISDTVTFATGIVAESGLSSDQRGRTELLELKPELSVAKIPLAASWRTSIGNVGIAPSIGLARYATNSSEVPGTVSQTQRKLRTATGFGASLGYSYEHGPHSFGAGWKSRSRFKLEAFADLDAYGPNSSPALDTLRLESPSQWNVGYHFAFAERWNLFLDVKRIEWASARGFKDYGWKDQWVSAFALEFAGERLSLRGGLNLSTPVYRSKSGQSASGVVDVQGKSIYASNLDFFNVVGYPAILTKTAAVGASLPLNPDRTSIVDIAVLHSFRENIARSGIGAFSLPYGYETKIQFTTVVATVRIQMGGSASN